MTDTTVKVGDVVAWDEVPSGAMVRIVVGDPWFALRMFARGCWIVSLIEQSQWAFAPAWDWHGCPVTATGKPIIAALNLTGHELADELRVLAEAFEREHPAT